MFFKKEEINNNNFITKVCALLIHAAKIDENYTDKEKKIIINFVEIFLKENNKNVSDSEIPILIEKAEKYEKDSNQILEFTKEIKKADLKSKKFIIKTLWQIILSDNKSGIYESNLMRRICGLLYLPDKFSGEIKSNILLEKKQ